MIFKSNLGVFTRKLLPYKFALGRLLKVQNQQQHKILQQLEPEKCTGQTFDPHGVSSFVWDERAIHKRGAFREQSGHNSSSQRLLDPFACLYDQRLIVISCDDIELNKRLGILTPKDVFVFAPENFSFQIVVFCARAQWKLLFPHCSTQNLMSV